MPDITVQFEFGSEGSLSKGVTELINKEIGKIQAGILDQPLLIKLDLDKASIENIKSRITELSKLASIPSPAAQAAADSAKRTAAALNDERSAYQQYIDYKTGVDTKAKNAERSMESIERQKFKERLDAIREEERARKKAADEADKLAKRQQLQAERDARAEQSALQKHNVSATNAINDLERLKRVYAGNPHVNYTEKFSDLTKLQSEAKDISDAIQNFTSGSGDISNIEIRLKALIGDIKQLGIEMANLDKAGSQKESKISDKSEKLFDKINEQRSVIRDLNKEYSEDKYVTSGQTENLTSYLSQLDKIQEDIRMDKLFGSLDEGKLESYKQRIDDITSSIKQLSGEMKRTSQNGFKEELTTDKQEYSNFYIQAKRKEVELKRFLANNTAAAKSSVPEVREAYEKLQALQSGYTDFLNYLENGKGGKGPTISGAREIFAGLNREVEDGRNIIKQSTDDHKTFADTLSISMKKFAQYFTATRVVMGAYRAMKQMVTESIAVNDAMTQFQIVTKANNNEMAIFSKMAYESSKRLGTSVKDVVSASTTYARLGYSIKESGRLAELTTMLQGVGDIDAQSAQSAVTAIVKAFNGIDINNIDTVMDKLVAVGNGAPISVAELAEGMNNASSALSAAGNSFDQTVALLTSANTTIQNAAQASTGLRTISARIRNTTTELDELGETLTSAEYDEIVQKLTDITLVDGSKASVSLTDVNGELRSIYDIISDIADVWGMMSANQQAALAETLAGTRQQNIFYSLVENFDEARNAMNLMGNSMNAMQDAYDVLMTSTTAHINQFKTAFSELSTDVVDSGLMNIVIDFGRKIIEVFDTVVKFSKNAGWVGEGGLAAGIFGIGVAIKSIS